MNVQLKDITVTARDGRVSHLDQVYIRGSHVRYFIVPDMLRYVDNSLPPLSRGRIMTAGTRLSLETRPCSVPVEPVVAVSVLPVAGLPSTGPAVPAAVAERLDNQPSVNTRTDETPLFTQPIDSSGTRLRISLLSA